MMQTSSARTTATHLSSPSSTMGSASASPSPSSARRRALLQADERNHIQFIDNYPLINYLDIADRSFRHFQTSYQDSKLNEAYVYGMRFSQLGLGTLPRHRDWIDIREEAKEHLMSKVREVLSKLEIIKRRMDEEETAKLRARMRARAEEQRQKEYLRQQEVRYILAQMEVMNENSDRNVGDSYLNAKRSKSKGGKVTKKFKKLLGFGRKKNYGILQPALPSIDIIRQVRDQEELQARIQPRPAPYVAPQYIIEEKPVAEEMTLKLHPMRLPSPSHIQYDPFPNERIQGKEIKEQRQTSPKIRRQDYKENTQIAANPSVVDGYRSTLLSRQHHDSADLSTPTCLDEQLQDEFDETQPCSLSSRSERSVSENSFVSSVIPIPPIDDSESDSTVLGHSLETPNTKERILSGITRTVKSTQPFEKGLVSRYELVLDELTKRLAFVYTSDHIVLETTSGKQHQSINKCNSVDENLSDAIRGSVDKFDAYLLAQREWTEGRDDTTYATKALVTEKESNEEKSFQSYTIMEETIISEDCSNHKSDDILAKGELVYGNDDFTYVTIVEEERGMAKEARERKSFQCSSVMEETLAEEDVYMDYSEPEKKKSMGTIRTEPKIEDENTSSCAVNSPTCVMSPRVQAEGQRLQRFPSLNFVSSIDNDEMSYITMDPYLAKIDEKKEAPSHDNCSERELKMLFKDLWQRDIVVVREGMEKLKRIVKNTTNTRATIAEHGGLVAIIKAMMVFQDDEVIQFLCCDTLGFLASEPEIKSFIDEMNVIPLISKSMIGHPDSERIQNAARNFVALMHSY